MSGHFPDHVLALPAGYVLESYRIVRVLGSGGFGITYLAVDTESHKQVAIKELLPGEIATRARGNNTVRPKTVHLAGAFEHALERFMREARALARLAHPNIVLIHRLFRANATAYMVMDYVEGRSLRQLLEERPVLSEQEVRAILMPLLSGLEHVHSRGLLHRDIKPDNIYVTADGRPLLLDFGSARVDVGGTQAMTTLVSEGYSPYEQYQSTVRQTPATDLYSLAGVVIRAITGKRPSTAIDRAVSAVAQRPVSLTHAGRYSRAFLHALDAAFSVDAAERPQSVAQWRDMLEGKAPGGGGTSRPGSWRPWVAALLVLSGLAAAAYLVVGAGGSGEGHGGASHGGTPAPVTATTGGTGTGDSGTPVARPEPAAPAVPAVPPRLALMPEPVPPAPEPVAPVPSVPSPAPVPPPAPAPPPEPSPSTATRDAPFINSLGLAFIPLPGNPDALLGRTEVRVSDFRQFAKETGYVERRGIRVPGRAALATGGSNGDWVLDPTKSWEDPGFIQGENHPVVGVNWTTVQQFVQWLSKKEGRRYRLPTDSEWSAAAGSSLYPWGDAWPPPQGSGNYGGREWLAGLPQGRWGHAYEYSDGYARTAPVGSYAANANGFHDLGGNVWEWCDDRYKASLNSASVLEAMPSFREELDENRGHLYVVRGGAWGCTSEDYMRISIRHGYSASRADNDIGFRLVLVLR